MRVLLLDPPRRRSPWDVDLVVESPLSAALLTGYAAASLRAEGFPVTVLAADLERLTVEQVRERVGRKAPDLLAVHLRYQWDRTGEVLELLRRLKADLPQAHLTAYGHFPTFSARELLAAYPALDSVVLGEPEDTLRELGRTLEEAGEWRGLPGLAVRRDGAVGWAARPPRADLDGLPFPERPDPSLVEARGIHTYVLGSRGCFGHCSFCYVGSFPGAGSPWRGRSPAAVVREMELLRRSRGSDHFYFADANFCGPGPAGRRRARELAALLRARLPGIRFGIETRAPDLDETLVRELVAGGLESVFLGLESGSPRLLARFGKGFGEPEQTRAVRLLREQGVRLCAGFIMFAPDSRLEDVRQSFRLLERLELLDDPVTTAHLLFHREVVLRGTADYRRLAEEGRLEPASFLGYEGHYRIADPQVERLSRAVGELARRVLAAARSGGAGAAGGEAVSRVLREAFRECLDRLARDGPEARVEAVLEDAWCAARRFFEEVGS